jgi:hypothetical protein
MWVVERRDEMDVRGTTQDVVGDDIDVGIEVNGVS